MEKDQRKCFGLEVGGKGVSEHSPHLSHPTQKGEKAKGGKREKKEFGRCSGRVFGWSDLGSPNMDSNSASAVY